MVDEMERDIRPLCFSGFVSSVYDSSCSSHRQAVRFIKHLCVICK